MSVSSIVILALLFFFTSVIGVVTGSNSLITVPVMFQFGVDPKVAVATNMFGLTFMAVGASVPFMRRGVIGYRKIWPLVVITVISSAIGAALVGLITDQGIKLIVTVAMISVAVFILLKRNSGRMGSGEDQLNAERGIRNAEFETSGRQIQNPKSKIQDLKTPVATAPGSDTTRNRVATAPGSDTTRNRVATAPGSDKGEPPRLPKRQPPLLRKEGSLKTLVYFLTFLLGIYGGLYSGGYVTILTAVYVAFFGMTFTEAVGSTKFINVFSSLVATIVFAWQGLIDYRLGVVLAAAMFAGGYVGAHYATKLNDPWIKRIFLAAVFLLAIKTLFDFLSGKEVV